MKRIVNILLILGLLLSTAVYWSVNSTKVEAASNKDTVEYKSGALYVGQLIKGIPNGKGTLTFPKGSVYKKYTGDFKNGKFEGSGTLLLANGKSVKGKFLKGTLVKYDIKTILKSGKSNYGASLQDGHAYGDYFFIAFNNYNENAGTFEGTITWDEVVYGFVDTIKGKVQGDKLVFSQVSRTDKNGRVTELPANTITVKMTDVNHLSGTWTIPGEGQKGKIKFTINPGDVSHLFNTYQVYAPSSTATLETKDYYITTTSIGALNGGLIIQSDGTYVWNSLIEGKVIKGKWRQTKDKDYPIELLKGELGYNWKVGESPHRFGEILLWSGSTSMNARPL
ncbi:hypothetical protein SAMN05880501_10558 [Ureibacillus xyleni]|uniref:MORN repeat protein n=1 Tax=Ureibacillus xyleni TaxID=614648 RepID=A0A285SKU9_9BACL|nr:hypothetical protein [Ureibacillus xyleni]SOC08314.1 hypothetical protein SAMN05880501_10558 [Ureibacillus xyleni]